MDAFSLVESYNVTSFLWKGQIKGQIKTKALSFPSDSWSVPFALSCICLFLQIILILLHLINTFRKPGSVIETEPSLTDTIASTFLRSLKKKVKSLGGWTIYLFMVARLFGCLVLFALSVNSLLRCQKNHPDADTVFKHLFVGCPEGFMTLTFVNPFLSYSSVKNTWHHDRFQFYCSIMAIVSVTVKEWSVSTTRYNILVLLSVFGVYIYRDIWPLATFTKEPKDLQEGYILWIKFSFATLTAVIIPLCIPRQYVPVDPKVHRSICWTRHFRRW